jgi:hypothetical protein
MTVSVPNIAYCCVSCCTLKEQYVLGSSERQQNVKIILQPSFFFIILIFWSCVMLLYPLSYALIVAVPNKVVNVVQHTMGEWW